MHAIQAYASVDGMACREKRRLCVLGAGDDECVLGLNQVQKGGTESYCNGDVWT